MAEQIMATADAANGGGEHPYDAVCIKVIAPELLSLAADVQVVWAKVDPYPHWPAQILPPDDVASVPQLASARHAKSATIPVAFFGEYTYGWLPEKKVVSWAEGIERGFHIKYTNALLQEGVKEVSEFLAPAGEQPRSAPEGWWTSPPSHQAVPKQLGNLLNSTTAAATAAGKPPPQPKKRALPAMSDDSYCEKEKKTSKKEKKEKIRWSARDDILKPLIKRLKELFPVLAAEPTPNATHELFEFVRCRFGHVLDIDQPLRNLTQFDLLAQLFTNAAGRPFTGAQLAGCFSNPNPHVHKLDSSALNALGVEPHTWGLPKAGSSAPIGPKPARPDTSAPVGAAAAASAAVVPVPVAAAAPAPVRPSGAAAHLETDPLAPAFPVVHGKLILTKARAKMNSALAPAEGSENGQSDPRLREPPNYVHLKQNLWVSRPKPKRLSMEETSVCNCRPPPLPTPVPAPAVAPPPAVIEEQQEEMPKAEEDAKMEEASNVEEELLVDDDAAIVRRLVEAIFAAHLPPPAAPVAAPILPALAAVVDNPPQAAFESVPDRLGHRARSASAGVAAAVAAAARRSSGSLDRRPSSGASEDAPSGQLPRDGCGEGCLNRLSFIHCDPKTCPCGERCSNRPFYQQNQPNMEVFLTTDKGWGVRAIKPMFSGSFVAEYVGEVVDDVEMALRMEQAKQRNEPHFYMMEMGPGLVIDARPKGNVARLLNSSCDPNCETQKWHDAATGEVRVGIFTLRDVAPGEELVYDYHFQQLFGLGSDEGEYSCKCGAATCRGSMDTQPERSRDYGRRIEIWWPGDEIFYPATVTGYAAATQRYSIKYDDGALEKVNLKEETYRWMDGLGDSAAAAAPPAKKAKKAAAAAAPRVTAVALGEVADEAPVPPLLPTKVNGASPKRRGRPPGTGKYQLAAAAAAVGLTEAVVAPVPLPAPADVAPVAEPQPPVAVLVPPPTTQQPAVEEEKAEEVALPVPAAIEAEKQASAVPMVVPVVVPSSSPAQPEEVILPVPQIPQMAPQVQTLPEDLAILAASIFPGLSEDQLRSVDALRSRLGPVLPAIVRQVAALEGTIVFENSDGSSGDDETRRANIPCEDAGSGPESVPVIEQRQPSEMKPALENSRVAVDVDDSAPVEGQAEAMQMNHVSVEAVLPPAPQEVAEVTEEVAVPMEVGDVLAENGNVVLPVCAVQIEAVENKSIDTIESAPVLSNGNGNVDYPSTDAAAAATVTEEEPEEELKKEQQQPQEPPAPCGVGPPLLLELRQAVFKLDPSAAYAKCTSVRDQLRSLCHYLDLLPAINGVIIDNPGAQHTAGKLHGNGRGSAPGRPSAPSSVSGRGRKRQRRVFGDEFIAGDGDGSDEDAGPAPASAPRAGRGTAAAVSEPASPPRGTPADAYAHAAAAMSPGAVAAATIAGLSELPPPPQVATMGRRGSSTVPAVQSSGGGGGGGGRRSIPTPASTGLPARTILVAKRLTNSDVSKGRILLPRAAVEANLSFAIGRAHSLLAKDHNSQSWEFTLQSWANGIESRRVFVLEHAGDYIKHHALKPEDVIGISTTETGEFLVEFNTDEVCSAAETQQAARAAGISSPAITGNPSAAPPGALPAGMNPLIQHNAGRCTRSEHCNKPAGHPGFCMRTPGAGRGRRPLARAPSVPSDQKQQQPGPPSVRMPKRRPSFEDVGRPKRSRRPSIKASSYGIDTEDDEMSYSEGMEDEEEEDAFADDAPTSPNRHHQPYREDDGPAPDSLAFQHQMMQQHLPHQDIHRHDLKQHGSGSGHGTPPPEAGGPSSVPPIFVMAPDESLPPPMPPHLRSPLRPSMMARQNSLPGPPSMSHAQSVGSLPSMPSMGPGGDMATGGVDSRVPIGGLPPTLPLSLPQPNHAVDVAAFLASHSPPDAKKGAQQQQQQRAKTDVSGQLPQAAGLALPQPVAVPTLPAAPAVDQPPTTIAGGGVPSPTSHQPTLPSAPLPLFGAPPPASAPGAMHQHQHQPTGQQQQVQQQQNQQQQQQEHPEFDIMSFLDGGVQ